MPSTSPKQRRTMAAAAHNPEFAKRMGIPVSVAKDFNQADKGKHFGSGGNVKKRKASLSLPPQLAAPAAGMGPPGGAPMGPGNVPPPGMKHGGRTKKHHFKEDGEDKKHGGHHTKHSGHKKHHFKEGGSVDKVSGGVKPKTVKTPPIETKERHWPLKGEAKDHHGEKVAMKHGGKLHSRGGGIAKKGFASGGSVRGDGIAERGHTRGRFT